MGVGGTSIAIAMTAATWESEHRGKQGTRISELLLDTGGSVTSSGAIGRRCARQAGVTDTLTPQLTRQADRSHRYEYRHGCTVFPLTLGTAVHGRLYDDPARQCNWQLCSGVAGATIVSMMRPDRARRRWFLKLISMAASST
jgi:hypothetical protein